MKTSYGTAGKRNLHLVCMLAATLGLGQGALSQSPARGPATKPTVRGGVGVGTSSSAAQFKDLVVTAPDGTTLLAADLSKGLGDWYMNGGQWSVVDGTIKQSTLDANARATIGNTNWTDYTLSVKARKIAGNEGFTVVFRARDASNYCWFNIGGWENKKAQVSTCIAGNRTPIGPSAPVTIEANRWYDVKVEVKGEKAICSLDGKVLCETELSEAPPPPPPQDTGPGGRVGGGRGNAQARGGNVPATQAGRGTAATQSAVAQPTDTERQTALRIQLTSGSKSNITKAFADFKKWYETDAFNAEQTFWTMRALFPPLTAHVPETMDLIQLAWKAKNAPTGNKQDPGYLYAMEASCLFQLGRPEEARAKVLEGLKLDPTHASEEFISYVAKAIPPKGAESVLIDLLPQVIIAQPEDVAVAEGALKLRIKSLNELGRKTEALADARSLFNVSAMRRTAEALVILDTQLSFVHGNDSAINEKFRTEQIEGAQTFFPGNSPRTSTVIADIKVNSEPYEAALKSQRTNEFPDYIRRGSLLLLTGRTEEAQKMADKALAIAKDSRSNNNINTASDLLARVYRAQDGTIGRANAFVATVRGTPAPANAVAPVNASPGDGGNASPDELELP